MQRRYLLVIMTALLVAQAALAQTFSVQGVLRDPLGRTVEDGSYLLTFKLYDAATGGTELWSEAHGSVPVQHGVVVVELGTVNSLAGVSFLTTYWLGVTVENHPEMQPRIKLAPTPYSLAVQGLNNRFPSTGNVGIGTTDPQVDLALGDNDTGLDQKGDGELALVTNGVEHLRVSPLGSVGVGTAAPAEKLHVAGSHIRVDNDFGIFSTNSAGNATGAGFDTQSDDALGLHAGGAERVRVQPDGKVGIGLNNPNEPLEVNGNIKLNGSVIFGDNSALASAQLGGSASSLSTPANTLIIADSDEDDSGEIQFKTGSSTDMLIDNAGGVRMGTTAPTDARLHVQGPNSTATALRIQKSIDGQSLLMLRDHTDVDRMAINVDFSTVPTFYDNADGLGWRSSLTLNRGHVGIGTHGPEVPLHVASTAVQSYTPFMFMNINEVNRWTAQPNFHEISIKANNVVVAQQFWAVSDARIKNVTGSSDGQQDLETLKQIDIVDYSYIDVVGRSDRPQKKLVAQQVRDVYPLAVNEGTDFIPNVYEMSTSTAHDAAAQRLTITTAKAHGLAVGDTVRIFDDVSRQQLPVRAVVDAHTFALDREQPIEQVFVFGKKVHDFLSVDYEAVAMLNVSATQEVIRRLEELEQHNATLAAELSHYQKLEQENAALKAELNQYQKLERENAMLKARMGRFEAGLQQLEAQLTGAQRSADVQVGAAD